MRNQRGPVPRLIGALHIARSWRHQSFVSKTSQGRASLRALAVLIAVTVTPFTGLLAWWSGASGASAGASTGSASQAVASQVIRAPIGYQTSTASGVTNGPVTPAAFDQWIGPGSSNSYGYVGGYDVTYNSTASSESIEVTLFSFHSHADAAAFRDVAMSLWGASSQAPARRTIRAISGSVVEVGSKAGSDGFYVTDAFAAKSDTVMIIEYANTTKPKPNGIPKVLTSVAVSQYSRIHRGYQDSQVHVAVAKATRTNGGYV